MYNTQNGILLVVGPQHGYLLKSFSLYANAFT